MTDTAMPNPASHIVHYWLTFCAPGSVTHPRSPQSRPWCDVCIQVRPGMRTS